MAPRTENAQKRKQTAENLEAAVSSSSSSSDDQRVCVTQRKRKACRVSMNAVASNAADEERIRITGDLIKDFVHPDNATVTAALGALFLHLNLGKDKKIRESFVTAGGCLALVQLLKNRLDKAITRIPACDHVTELNELAELTTLLQTLCVIMSLTSQHAASGVEITEIGGLEAVGKIMKTFPKCQALQVDACGCLVNLVSCSIGKAIAIESGGLEALLAAINNHLGSAILCQKACEALCNILHDSKENTRLLISLGGGAAVYKVGTKWPDNNDVQTQVRKLVDFIGVEMKALASKK